MNLTTHQIGFYLVIITTIHLSIFWITNWKSILDGIRGQDGKFQLIEIIGYVSCVIWPSMLMSDAYFGFNASEEAWTSINIVIAVSVLGISYNRYMKMREDKKEEGV